MPKSFCLGNGSSLILFDRFSQLRDLYFPYVGLENHIGGHNSHRIGVYTDGLLHWLDNPAWQIEINCENDSMSGATMARNHTLNVALHISDTLFNETNIFIRKIKIQNLSDHKRQIKIFFHQQFELYESNKGDTAFYDPLRNVIIHYKGRRVFLLALYTQHHGFDDFAVGRFGTPGKNGTYQDAEDGILSKNPIEHGSVDSVIGKTFELEPNEQKILYYSMIMSQSIPDAYHLHSYVIRRSPEYLIKTTKDYWHAWVNKQDICLCPFDDKIKNLFNKSLLVVRAHIDNNGGIIAAGDSEFLEHGKDTYAYVWPRDGAYVVSSLIELNEFTIAERFFNFCSEVITEDGYIMHKYRVDRSLGSSWHPWISKNQPTLPIQEDETAHILVVLWRYYELTKNLELIESLYNNFIKRAAEFLVKFTDTQTGLPMASYDLWEERLQVTTYTAATVYAGILAAAKFATILGKHRRALTLDVTAEKIKSGVVKYLYDEDLKYFYRGLTIQDGIITPDKTVDASAFYGIFHFGLLSQDDEKLKSSVDYTIHKLTSHNGIGGIARYEGDIYYRSHNNIPGNPWFITTLWIAQYKIATAKSQKELLEAYKLLQWAEKYTLPSGVMSEQLDPYNGSQLSVSPLTWSHAEFIRTIYLYVKKYEALKLCKNVRDEKEIK